MIFKPMSLKEAKCFYEELKKEKSHNRLVTIAMDDIYFFTNGLTKDYGFIHEVYNSLEE